MKSRFLLEPPAGFRGVDWNTPVRRYHRHLPHWRQDGATYFVTFRLADSLPACKREELAALKLTFEQEIACLEQTGKLTEAEREGIWRRYADESFRKTERWLDLGSGCCVLGEPAIRNMVRERITFFHNERYDLGALVVMPNHAHLLMRPFAGFELERLQQSRKRVTSIEINKYRQSKGVTNWCEESHDRMVRDAEHLWRCLQYIGNNPKKAGLAAQREDLRWVAPEWRQCGWDFVDEPC